jgi:hypothetical protein
VASSKQVFQDLVPCRLAEKQEDQGTAAHFPLELMAGMCLSTVMRLVIEEMHQDISEHLRLGIPEVVS